MWLDRSKAAVLALLLASGAGLCAQSPKTEGQAPAAEAKAPVASTKSSKAAKPKAKAPAPDQADLKPLVAAQSQARSKSLKEAKRKAKPVPESARVDINRASKEELLKLPGMTDAYASKLIAGRPYKTKAHLVTHDILPYALYDALKGRIIAKQ